MTIRWLKNEFLRKFCHEKTFSWQPNWAIKKDFKTVDFE